MYCIRKISVFGMIYSLLNNLGDCISLYIKIYKILKKIVLQKCSSVTLHLLNVPVIESYFARFQGKLLKELRDYTNSEDSSLNCLPMIC